MKAQLLALPQAVKEPRLLVAIFVFVLTFALRIRGVGSHFFLLGDQIRDWSIALKPFTQLPLIGPPTHVGGYTLGPAFYWILWSIRVGVGPFFDNLPHAGGIGQAAIQSAADAILLVAIWRRTKSPWIALATVVLVATASFDLSLAALVWNPTMGTALAKIAMAMILLEWHRGSHLRALAAAAVAWSAVQAYTGAVFVAVGIFIAMLADPLIQRDWRLTRRNALAIAAAVALLQLPYVAYQITHRFQDEAMGAVTDSVTRVLSGERQPEVAKSIDGYVEAVRYIQIDPWSIPRAGWALLFCCGIVAVRHYKDPVLLSVTLLPQLAAIAGYALFLATLDIYYYLSLMPCAVLTCVLALTAVPSPGMARVVGILLLAGALALVPGRIRHERVMNRMPEYGLLVDASRKIRSLGQPMRAIETDFKLPPTANPEFLFEVLGGRIDRNAQWICLIRANGTLSYRQVPGS
jgi:hypothetical protein